MDTSYKLQNSRISSSEHLTLKVHEKLKKESSSLSLSDFPRIIGSRGVQIMKNFFFGPWLRVLLLAALLPCLLAWPQAEASISREGEIATPAYWQAHQKDGTQVLLSHAEIQQLNAKMHDTEPTLRDMTKEPAQYDGETVKALIWNSTQEYWPKDTMDNEYTDAGWLSWAKWNDVLTNRNIANVPAQVNVRYAVTTTRGDLRLLPEAEGWYSGPGEISRHYDSLQATAVDPGEAAAVLHISGDGRFAFVELRHYRGWLALDKLAFTDRTTWQQFAAPQDFLVVTAPKIRLTAGGQEQVYQMGAKIPGQMQADGRFLATLPVNQQGELTLQQVPLTPNDDLHRGFLPYTRNHTITQAFRFLGSVYGWGGQDESVDCSSFVGDVYRSMGIEIPRDADRQEAAMPHRTPMYGSTAERYATVRTADVGALLFKPGHVMMYLGTDDSGTPMVIHCASSYYAGGYKHYIRQVIVSDLTYQNGSGTATIDGLTSIGQVR